jgi:hypothetical protein
MFEQYIYQSIKQRLIPGSILLISNLDDNDGLHPFLCTERISDLFLIDDIDYTQLYKQEGVYDNIIIHNALEYSDRPTVILQNAAKLLHRNGCAHIVVPNSDSIHRLLQDYNQENYKRTYNRTDFWIEVNQNGFGINSCEGIMLQPLDNTTCVSIAESTQNAMYKLSQHRDLWKYCSFLYMTCWNRWSK